MHLASLLLTISEQQEAGPEIFVHAGTVRVRTLNGDTLFFESSLNNALDVTGVHLHLSPGGGAVFGIFLGHTYCWIIQH